MNTNILEQHTYKDACNGLIKADSHYIYCYKQHKGLVEIFTSPLCKNSLKIELF